MSAPISVQAHQLTLHLVKAPNGRPATIDLAHPRTVGLVRRLYLGRQGSRVRRAGLDVEDGLHEVWCRLLRRVETSPYDPTRGGVSTYLHMIIQSATTDYLRSEARRRARDGEPLRSEDAALVDQPPVAW